MKILKLSANFFGLFALITGLSSCGKDKDKDSATCCSSTFSYSSNDFTTEVCEDGTITNSYMYDGETYTYTDKLDWEEYGITWENWLNAAERSGWDCK